MNKHFYVTYLYPQSPMFGVGHCVVEASQFSVSKVIIQLTTKYRFVAVLNVMEISTEDYNNFSEDLRIKID